MVSRFADHIPYYREQINARSRVHTPRTTLASWAGHASVGVAPLLDAHRAFVFSAKVLHADETPVAMLDPGSGKTKRAYVWAYARGAFDPHAQRCSTTSASAGPGATQQTRSGKWSGTLIVDDYAGYDQVLKVAERIEAGCLAHRQTQV